jgi:hypothetical protein
VFALRSAVEKGDIERDLHALLEKEAARNSGAEVLELDSVLRAGVVGYLRCVEQYSMVVVFRDISGRLSWCGIRPYAWFMR